ncbi:TetR/AcrR family transcriptional regulator [Zavarzinia compransoris]|uniref:TetR/AcrR family transcriptional regulator n=1 Tax=Zavarzinia marina TaxID=2911065 RepID=UPI001F33CE69|nr:TetR/AcrR family transcriptional regulator [Zavarzinia marina]MCF4167220.1 TetR/AcrR family transcriptional regulator [Zavarzinia marina]
MDGRLIDERPIGERAEAEGGRRAATKAQNRAQILVAAREVFASLGYDATTVRDIIRRTSLASGTFYNYFPTKEAVFRAVVDDSARRLRKRLRAERRSARTFEEFCYQAYSTYFRYVVEDRPTYDLIRRNVAAIATVFNSPELAEGRGELREDVEDAVHRGLLPAGTDPDYLTLAIHGIAVNMAGRMIETGDNDVERAARFATNLLVRGAQAAPRG